MAIKFSKTDDLDKMFENFASFPDVEKKVEFPEEKKKAETATTKEAKKDLPRFREIMKDSGVLWGLKYKTTE